MDFEASYLWRREHPWRLRIRWALHLESQGTSKESPDHDCETRSTPSARSQFRCLGQHHYTRTWGVAQQSFCRQQLFLSVTVTQPAFTQKCVLGGPPYPPALPAQHAKQNGRDRLVLSTMGDLVLSGRRLIRLSAHIPQLEMISAHYLHF